MAAGDPLDIPAGAPDERVDALYGLPLEDFTAARDALAAELRKGGERVAATWVKSLRKPSAPAWTVNQLARTRRRDAQRLVAAGDALREAQERVLDGRAGATDLRAAAAREAEAVRALREAAPGLLDRDGHSPSQATLDRVEQTLQAVALEDEARDEFAAGRLTRERRATGLGLLGGPGPPARGSSEEGSPEKGSPERKASAKKGSPKRKASAKKS